MSADSLPEFHKDYAEELEKALKGEGMYGFIRITRIASLHNEGTFGALKINGRPFCVTLEPARSWNQKNISAIPAGQYICKRYNSPKYGLTWRVMNVPLRSYVLFHAGNLKKHTRACLLLAQHYGKLQGNWAVLNSGKTFRRFLDATNGYDTLHLTITDHY